MKIGQQTEIQLISEAVFRSLKHYMKTLNHREEKRSKFRPISANQFIDPSISINQI